MPLVHKRPWQCKSSWLPVTFQSSLSFLCTNPEHFQKHILQTVGVTETAPGGGRSAYELLEERAPKNKGGVAAARPVVRESLIKSLRFISGLYTVFILVKTDALLFQDAANYLSLHRN